MSVKWKSFIYLFFLLLNFSILILTSWDHSCRYIPLTRITFPEPAPSNPVSSCFPSISECEEVEKVASSSVVLCRVGSVEAAAKVCRLTPEHKYCCALHVLKIFCYIYDKIQVMQVSCFLGRGGLFMESVDILCWMHCNLLRFLHVIQLFMSILWK